LAAAEMPVDGEHLSPHQLFADDVQQRLANRVQAAESFGPDFECAGTVVDLAPAAGTYEYTRAVEK
jgi:hypothetical protein